MFYLSAVRFSGNVTAAWIMLTGNIFLQSIMSRGNVVKQMKYVASEHFASFINNVSLLY